MVPDEIEDGIVPGWYHQPLGDYGVIFLRSQAGPWYVVMAYGTMVPVTWEYVVEATANIQLELLAPLGGHPTDGEG